MQSLPCARVLLKTHAKPALHTCVAEDAGLFFACSCTLTQAKNCRSVAQGLFMPMLLKRKNKPSVMHNMHLVHNGCAGDARPSATPGATAQDASVHKTKDHRIRGATATVEQLGEQLGEQGGKVQAMGKPAPTAQRGVPLPPTGSVDPTSIFPCAWAPGSAAKLTTQWLEAYAQDSAGAQTSPSDEEMRPSALQKPAGMFSSKAHHAMLEKRTCLRQHLFLAMHLRHPREINQAVALMKGEESKENWGRKPADDKHVL
eukprot:scaffold87836_cov18-Tisochrysis_lutea.AAC.1